MPEREEQLGNASAVIHVEVRQHHGVQSAGVDVGLRQSPQDARPGIEENQRVGRVDEHGRSEPLGIGKACPGAQNRDAHYCRTAPTSRSNATTATICVITSTIRS